MSTGSRGGGTYSFGGTTNLYSLCTYTVHMNKCTVYMYTSCTYNSYTHFKYQETNMRVGDTLDW